MVTLVCPFCKEIWDYKGKKTVYASCPDCRNSVKIKTNEVQKEDKNEKDNFGNSHN